MSSDDNASEDNDNDVYYDAQTQQPSVAPSEFLASSDTNEENSEEEVKNEWEEKGEAFPDDEVATVAEEEVRRRGSHSSFSFCGSFLYEPLLNSSFLTFELCIEYRILNTHHISSVLRRVHWTLSNMQIQHRRRDLFESILVNFNVHSTLNFRAIKDCTLVDKIM
jgi:hypothetical protein